MSERVNEELVREYQGGNKEVLNKIIEKNLGMVQKIVSKFYVNTINSIERDDLVQEGTIALIKAIEMYKFDIEKKAKFSTYAFTVITSLLKNYLNHNNTKDEISLNVSIGDSEVENIELIEDKENLIDNTVEREYIKWLNKELEYGLKKYTEPLEENLIRGVYGFGCSQLKVKEVAILSELSEWKVRAKINNGFARIRSSGWGNILRKEIPDTHLKSFRRRIKEIDYEAMYIKKYTEELEKELKKIS